MAAYLNEFYQVSFTRACKTLSFAKSMYYYRSVKDDREVIDKLLELAAAKPREGQDKYYQRLRLQGYGWNKKRIRRVYLMWASTYAGKPKRGCQNGLKSL